jgi:hypothetical protein
VTEAKRAPDNTGLAWSEYRCSCGGRAAMGIMSLVARCDTCPRVYVFGMRAHGWYSDIEAANKAEAAH